MTQPGIAMAAAILVTGAWLLAGVLKGSPPSEVWLPKDELNEWLDGRISLFENSGTSRSAQYGSGISL